MPDVDDVDEKVRVIELLERRAERRDESRRELADEADRVRDEDRAAARQRHPPRRRIQRRERLVGDEHGRTRQGIEQRRLADVRVADQSREEQTVAASREPAALALLLYFGEPRLEIDEAPLDDAPVCLEEGLARSACPDATAEPRQTLPDAAQARQLVLELRDLDLHASFLCLRVASEDVEDQLRAIDDPAACQRFETALLPRREPVVAYDEIRGDARAFGADLRGLALPHPGVRVGRAALLDGPTRDDAGGRLDQRGELLERILRIEARAWLIESDQERALGPCGGIDQPDSVAGSGSSAVGSTQRTAPSRRNQVISRRE